MGGGGGGGANAHLSLFAGAHGYNVCNVVIFCKTNTSSIHDTDLSIFFLINSITVSFGLIYDAMPVECTMKFYFDQSNGNAIVIERMRNKC